MHQQRNIKCPKKAMLVPELRTVSHWLSYASSEVDINLLGIIVLMTSLSKIFEASWLNKMSEDCTSARDLRMYQQSIAFKLLALKTTTNSTSKTSRSIVASNQAARLNLWIVVPLGLRDIPQIQWPPVRRPKMPLPPRSPQKSSHFVSLSVCPPVSLYANLSRSDDDIL